MSNADLPVTLTVKQAMRRSNLGRRMLYRLMAAGHIRSCLVLGRRMIDRKSLDWVALHGVDASSAPRKWDEDRDAV